MGAAGGSGVGGVRGGRVPGEAGDAPAVLLEGAAGGAVVPADEPVDVEQAVQVVGLVLQAAGEEAAPLDLDRGTVEVDAGHLGPLGPPGRELLAGHREAALPVLVGVRHGL